MIDTFQMRNSFAQAWFIAVAGLTAGTTGAFALDFEDEIFTTPGREVASAPPVEGSAGWADLIVARFAAANGWDTEFVKDGNGDPEALRLFIPSPLISDAAEPAPADLSDGIGTFLPMLPYAHVSRFKKIPFGDGVNGMVAFRIVDVGWNTPEKENGGAPAQFDILFHTNGDEPADTGAECAADDKNCVPPPTEREIAKRLADRPPKCFLPRGALPVAERATPETGLFNLASGPDNASSDPVTIYGTYDNEIVFLGVSLTLETLQHAVDEGILGDRLSWPVNQPSRYRHAWWPRTIALEYRDDQNLFALSLEDFSKRKVRTSCK